MKKNSLHPNEDLQTIRRMMERSSKFLSLSGLSGVSAGICALAGAWVAWLIILDNGWPSYGEFLRNAGTQEPATGIYLVLDALLVLGFAGLCAVYFSFRKAKKAGQPFWTYPTRRLLIHLMIPMSAGGIFAAVLVLRGNTELVVPVMLIFYGLSLVNAGKFTFGEIHYLGLTEVLLGILAAIFINLGLLFWTLGFGFMHIIYGIVMFLRYER